MAKAVTSHEVSKKPVHMRVVVPLCCFFCQAWNWLFLKLALFFLLLLSSRTCSTWTFLSQRGNLSPSFNLHHSWGITGSLTQCTGLRSNPRLHSNLSHCSQILNPLCHSGNSRISFSFLFFSFSLLATPMAHGSSWAWDQIWAGVVTYATAAATPDP